MEIDLLLDPFGASWEEMREAALAAEEAGFGGVWTWDHLAGAVHGEARVVECWTVLSALAATVPRLMLGPCVLNAANRDPGTLAVMAATLQEVSGGRLLLGIGAGGGPGTPYAAEQRALGRAVPGDVARRRQVEAAIGVLREVWSGRRAGVGGFLRPSPPPPIIVGGFGPKMAELAGRLGDGINLPATSPYLAQLLDVARQARATHRPNAATTFIATAFTGFDEAWLRPDTPRAQRLAQAGVDRLILLVSAPFPLPRMRRLRAAQ